MGMSASQARLLSITSRINDIELKSQQVANIKMRLASESEAVATKYTNALNKQKLTMTSYGANGAQKVNVTINSLNQVGSNMKLCTRSGKQVVSQTQAKAYQTAIADYNRPNTWAGADHSHKGNYANAEAVYALMMKFDVTSYKDAYEKCGLPDGTIGGMQPLIEAGKITQEEVDGLCSQWSQLFNSSTGTLVQGNQNNGSMNADAVMVVDDSLLNNTNWLHEAIESGEFYLADASGKEISISGNTQLGIESDTTNLAKEEADYNAATLKINNKEKKLDMEMKALDTEHSALKTEFDSVKQLIGDNIDKSFQLFS